MDNKQKQRVVGIVFLVVLAVVAVPAFLKRSWTTEHAAPSAEETLNTQGSPSALPVEPLAEPSQQPSAELPSAPPMAQQPSDNRSPVTGQPAPAPSDPVVTTPPAGSPAPASSVQPPVPGAQGQSQGPVPVLGDELPAAPAQRQEAPPVDSSLGPVVQQPTPNQLSPSPENVISTPAEPVKQPPVMKKAVTTTSHENAIKSNTGPRLDWVIRLAILSVRANAEKLIHNMKKHGYVGQMEAINTYKGMTYRVTLKKHGTRTEAEQLGQKLNKLFHVNVIINKSR